MKKTLALMLICIAMSNANASSNEAWAQDDLAMKAACLKASQLKNSQLSGDIMMFDDQVGYSAQVISGRYPQSDMNGRPGRELCLWKRDTRTAQVVEADTLLDLKRISGGCVVPDTLKK